MDYKFLIYPSNEKEMMSVKSEAKAKVIKIVQSKKLKEVYKANFGTPVKRFNDTALAGRMIDDYYQSIAISNIPEVYCISIIVRYDLGSKEEAQIVEKSFSNFKKELDKMKNIAISYVYWISQDEFKELQVYFVPVVSGFFTGLSVRNDLIELIKREYDIKENINIIKAMPYVNKYFEKIWHQTSDEKIVTEAELDKMARDYQPDDPMILHSIEVGQLKENMNRLNLLNNSNQMLKDQVEAEKNRIRGDLEWIAQTEPKICKAEADRIAEEKRKMEEELRQKESERLAEIQRKEELRRFEENRISEAERLTEQAKRNIALRAMLSREIEGSADVSSFIIESKVEQNDFDSLMANHQSWVSDFGITPSTDFNKLPSEILNDRRRMSLENVELNGIQDDKKQIIIGANFKNVKIKNCSLIFDIIGCDISNIILEDSTISNSLIEKSTIRNITCEQGTITNFNIESSTVIDSNFAYSELTQIISAPAMVFANVSFEKSKFNSCDMKRNSFTRCSFESAKFINCDIRSSTFQRCVVENINKINSLFNGTGV